MKMEGRTVDKGKLKHNEMTLEMELKTSTKKH